MRLCCGCFQRQKSTNMLRLQLNAVGTLTPVSKKLNGRSAWVCFDEKCIQAVVRHPKKMFRSLKILVSTSHLVAAIQQWLLMEIQSIIQRLYQDGCLKKIPSQDSNLTIYLHSNHETLTTLTSLSARSHSISSKPSTDCNHHPIYITPHKLNPTLSSHLTLLESF